MLGRRGFLTGLLAMPAIIRTPGLLMAVKPVSVTIPFSLLPGAVNRIDWDLLGDAVLYGLAVWRPDDLGRLVRVPPSEFYLPA